jgi:hypothetical protein
MKKNDVVMVYEDPLTRRKPEGQARLVKYEGSYPICGEGSVSHLERWIVEFINHEEDGGLHRLIKTED